HHQLEGFAHLFIGGGGKAHLILLPQMHQDWVDADVIEAGGDRGGLEHVAVVVLKEIGFKTLGNTNGSVFIGQARSVHTGVGTVTARLTGHQLHPLVVESSLENADGGGTAADAGIDPVGVTTGNCYDLFFRVHADNGLEVTDHLRKQMGAAGGAQHIVGVLHIGDRIVLGFVDG